MDAQKHAELSDEDPLQRLHGIVYPVALCRPWLISNGHLTGIRLDYDGTPLLSGLGLDPEARLP